MRQTSPTIGSATDYYAVRGNADRRAGLVAGYGRLPDDAEARLAIYRLYHALELWNWFASLGNTAPLTAIAGDIRELIGPGEPTRRG